MRGMAILCAVVMAGSSALAAPAPKMAITSLSQLATPPQHPYDETADAKAKVAEARARARREGKLLLIDLGGNWCPDCRILAGLMERPELAAFVEAHYVVVFVDVGHMDKNLEIPGRYGVKAVTGVPSLLVIDRQDRLVNQGHTTALDDARHMTPQAMADYLARWT